MRLLLCLLFAASSLTAATLPPAEQLQFADGLYAREMYAPALQEYEAFLEAAPNSPDADVAYFRMGECHRNLGDPVQAEKDFRQVFVKYPKSKYRLRAGFRRAELFMETQQYQAAVDLFQMVLKENPPEDLAAAGIYMMAESYQELGEDEKAADSYRKVEKTYPSSEYASYALLKLGMLHAGIGKSAPGKEKVAGEKANEALRFFQQASEHPATDRVGAEALFQLAELYLRLGEYEKSTAAYKSLQSRYPDDPRTAESRLQSAWAAHNAGLYAEALQRVEDGLKSASPENREEWLYLKANAERQLLKNEASIETYGDLLKAYPNGHYAAAARYERALTYYKMGRFREAVEEAQKIQLKGAIRKDAYWLLAESYAALKEDDQAIQYYRLLVREFPDSDVSADATYRLAHHLQKKGAFREAAKFYQTLAEKYPDGDLAPEALFASGVCLSAAGAHEAAVRDWAELIRRYPKSSLAENALYQKAMGEIRVERKGDAAGTLRKLLKDFPKSEFATDARYWLGMLEKDSGNWQDAENLFRKALEGKPRPELVREIKFQLASVLLKVEKQAEAANIFQELLAAPLEGRMSPQLLQWMAEYRCDTGDYKNALVVADKLIEIADAPEAKQTGWALKGRAQRALGETAAAEKSFRAALKIDADTDFAAECALRLGEIALSRNAPEEAVPFFEDAAARASGEGLLGIRARAYAGLGKASEKLSRYEAAAKYFMSVAILYDDPDLVPECLHEAAELFEKLGDSKAAVKAKEELKERYPDSPYVKSTQSG